MQLAAPPFAVAIVLSTLTHSSFDSRSDSPALPEANRLALQSPKKKRTLCQLKRHLLSQLSHEA